MNIFILDDNIGKAVQAHCDQHVVKMTLETAQILCTVHHYYYHHHVPGLYKPTHVKHPCVIWAAESLDNYQWLYQFFLALCQEYTYRCERIHLCEHKLKELLKEPPVGMVSKGLTPFAQAMPDQYKQPNAVNAYRAYYIGEKLRFARWTKRPAPDWIKAIFPLTEKSGLEKKIVTYIIHKEGA